ncbi:MAG TPA: prenyltransferase/squalene oxidase repeat-containing protein [Pirellulales bacterium]|jgi:squalene-hopene/tetraprenyl-beta-curcumene cyclase|nr:prenyltransferase/squalene oxidase repeat-containing protein [Pirellulales bacterium]
MRPTALFCVGVTLAFALLLDSIAGGAEPSANLAPEKQYAAIVAKAYDFLSTKGQAADGSFSAQDGPAVTAIVAHGLLKTGRSASDPVVAKALEYAKKFVHPDGGIYSDGSRHKNYETCACLPAFVAANGDGRYRELIAKADAFVRSMQWDAANGVEKSDDKFGGAGYGNSTRPDLSNTSFLIDALRSAGAKPDDPAVQEALLFVSRCQNLESAYNTTPFAAKNPDGGFYYTPSGGGSSPAGETPDKGLRSYGSMTYAGLKSMIYAGVGPDDPRVKAATKWVQSHYDLASNPDMGSAGLYYYYQALAKALEAVGSDTLEDSQGQKHEWRKDLIAELAKRQQPNGSWVNENKRWLEGDANLVTGYVLLTLSYCQPKK